MTCIGWLRGLLLVGAIAALTQACSDDPAPATSESDDDARGDDDDDDQSDDDADDQSDDDETPPKSTCKLPKDCKPVETSAFTLDACCTEEVECGFDLVKPVALRDAVIMSFGIPEDASKEERCVDRSRYFLTLPGDAEERVPTEDGEDILIASDCESTSMLSVTFIGCCMPNSKCGVSTYGIWDTLSVLVDGEEHPFTKLECVPYDELNDQLADSKLAGFAYLPEPKGSCDYQELSERLPPVSE